MDVINVLIFAQCMCQQKLRAAVLRADKGALATTVFHPSQEHLLLRRII